MPEQSWIDDVWVRSTLQHDLRSAIVRVRVETSGGQAAFRWALTDPTGRDVGQDESRASGPASEFEIAVQEPLLWWPRMSGPQNLYTLDVNPMAGEPVLDRRRTHFGIREVKPVLKDSATGEPRFRFEVNGQPIFLRGGNWVPIEGATHVWQPDRARQLLELAEHGHMNMLRIWGEGVLPPRSFYDECDRRGICLWQDFMYLEPKIAHYFLRHAYAPVLVSFERTPDRISVWVINESDSRPETNHRRPEGCRRRRAHRPRLERGADPPRVETLNTLNPSANHE